MDERRGDPPGRRDEDNWKNDFTKQLMDVVSAVRGIQIEQEQAKDNHDLLRDEVEKLRDFLLGGFEGREPVDSRLLVLERTTNKLDIILNGPSPDKHGVIGMVKEATEIAKDARSRAQAALDGEELKITRMGHNKALLGTFLLALFGLATALVGSWDTFFKKTETPDQYAERLINEIAELKKTRGPEIDKKLREIEKFSRRRR